VQGLDPEETNMPITFAQMVAEAMGAVPAIEPLAAARQCEVDPLTLIVDVRDAADIPATGLIAGAAPISLGSLTYKADAEVSETWRDPRLTDRSRPILVTCYSGEMASLGGRLLKEMGFTNVCLITGGTVAWKAAGLPMQAAGE
jgi:rhodanese-related sulfurtransferase